MPGTLFENTVTDDLLPLGNGLFVKKRNDSVEVWRNGGILFREALA